MPIKSDGSRPSGSRVLGIKQGSTATARGNYIADDFSIDKSTQFLDGRNEVNEPDGGTTLSDFETGSANLQLASSSTDIPQPGDQFVEVVDPLGLASDTFYVTHVGEPESKGALKRVSIQFRWLSSAPL